MGVPDLSHRFGDRVRQGGEQKGGDLGLELGASGTAVWGANPVGLNSAGSQCFERASGHIGVGQAPPAGRSSGVTHERDVRVLL